MGVKALPQVSESGHQDANQNFSVIGVQGTLGTADVTGSAPTVPFSADPTTGAQYVYNLGPAGSVSLGNTPGGTINQIGTVLGIGGTVQVSGASAGTNINIVTGTQQTLGTVGVLNAGTLNALASGTISAGTVQVSAGTIVGTFLEVTGSATAGTTDLIASMDVSNYKWFSIQLANTWVGTIAAQVSNDNISFFNQTTYPITNTSQIGANIITANALSSGPVVGRYMRIRMLAFTSGTAQSILELFSVPSQLHSLGVGASQSGAWSISNGTLSSGTLTQISTVGTLAAGTINALASGTITGGTIQNINAGTIQQNFTPIASQSTFGTHGTTGATVFGTLAGGTSSGAGTEIFITSLSLTIPSTAGSQDVSIGWGTNAGTFHAGTGRLVRGNFPAGGGIQKEFNPAINSGTNAQLTYFQAGAGTVEIDVTTFTTASVI